MLVPPSANAGRHFEAYPRSQIHSWGNRLHVAWNMALHLHLPSRE
jgi:hypothetical protein